MEIWRKLFQNRELYILGEKLLDSVDDDETQTVEQLLKKGADIDHKNEDGETALHLAAMNGSFTIVAILLKNGAKVNAKTKDRWTPLHYACYTRYGSEENHRKILEMLLEYRADVNARTVDGWTPLFEIATEEGGYASLIEILISHRATVNASDKQGWTPLHVAAYNNNKKIVQRLMSQGADATRRSQSRLTPVDIAKQEGHDELAGIMRNENVKQLELTKTNKKSSGFDFDELVRELCEIGVRIPENGYDSGFLRGSKTNDRAYEIGQVLYNRCGGSLDLMLKAHGIVEDVLGWNAARELEVCWHGIGEWRG